MTGLSHAETGIISIESGMMKIRRGGRRYAVLRCLLLYCVSVLCFTCLMELFGLLTCLREGFCCWCGCFAGGGLLLYFLYRLYGDMKKWGDLRHLALEVEKAHPEYLDSFICALETEAEGKKRTLGRVERELLAEVSARVDRGELAKVFSGRTGLCRQSCMLLAAVLCVCIFCRTEFMSKAVYGCGALLGLCDSGVVTVSGGVEVRRNEDYRVEVTFLRWGNEGIAEYRFGNGEIKEAVMTASGGNDAWFTLYEVGENFSYRVKNRGLCSGWRSVTVYDTPSYSRIEITAEPLEYTGRNSVTLNELRDVELAEGGRLGIKVETGTGVSAYLNCGGSRQGFISADEGWFELETLPEGSGEYSLELQDKDGHIGSYGFRLEVIPDLPPVITMETPEEDEYIKEGGDLVVNAEILDDYGVASAVLGYSVNGGERIYKGLPLAGDDCRKVRAFWRVKVSELGLKAGDVLSCMLSARDNKPPEGQVAKSNLFFVTVRPDEDSPEMDGMAGQSEKKADVSDLIAESKRLLRLTWDIGMASEELSGRLKEELPGSLGELELEVRKRLEDLREEAGGELAPPLPELFRNGAAFIGRAGTMAERQLFEESLAPQEAGLAALTAIETELLKNQIKSKKGEGENGGGSSEGQDEKEEKSGSGEGDAVQDTAAVKRLLEELLRIIPEQVALNSGGAGKSLASRQKQLYGETGRVSGALGKIKAAKSAGAAVKTAAAEMKSGCAAFEAENTSLGKIHGNRAVTSLTAAVEMLEELLRSRAAASVRELARTADELAAEQGEAGRESAEGKPERKSAMAKQDGINRRTGELLEKIRQEAAAAGDDFPGSAVEMLEALSGAEKRGLQKTQTRAKNALLYSRFESAGREQGNAANYLRELANGLQTAADRMSAPGEEELRAAMEDIQRRAQQISSGRFGEDSPENMSSLEEKRGKAGRAVGDMGRMWGNEELQQLGDRMQLPSGEASLAEASLEAVEELREASRVLGRMLEGLQLRKTQMLARRPGLPPERYRRQVEQYFKQIGTEQN